MDLSNYKPRTEAYTPPSLSEMSPAPVFHLRPLRQSWRLRIEELSHDVSRAFSRIRSAAEADDEAGRLDAWQASIDAQKSVTGAARDLLADHLMSVAGIESGGKPADVGQVIDWLMDDGEDTRNEIVAYLRGGAAPTAEEKDDSGAGSTT